MAPANPRGIRVWRVPEEAGPGARLVLQEGSRWLDLSAQLGTAGDDLVGLVEAGFFTAELLDPMLAEGEWTETAAPERVLTPIDPRAVGKVLALGKNFRDHAAEFGEEVPAEPMFFNKLPETLVPHGSTVTVPSWYTRRVDHEAELAVLIGRRGRDVSADRARDFVAGYTVANDLSARSLQGDDRKLRYPWLRSKNLDGFCPLGPCLVPRDYLDVGDLRVTARVIHPGSPEPEPRQDASTRDWIVDVPTAIAWVSRHLTLHPGDLLLTGTPAGVGPLADGDRVVCAVEGIGELETTLARPTA